MTVKEYDALKKDQTFLNRNIMACESCFLKVIDKNKMAGTDGTIKKNEYNDMYEEQMQRKIMEGAFAVEGHIISREGLMRSKRISTVKSFWGRKAIKELFERKPNQITRNMIKERLDKETQKAPDTLEESVKEPRKQKMISLKDAHKRKLAFLQEALSNYTDFLLTQKQEEKATLKAKRINNLVRLYTTKNPSLDRIESTKNMTLPDQEMEEIRAPFSARMPQASTSKAQNAADHSKKMILQKRRLSSQNVLNSAPDNITSANKGHSLFRKTIITESEASTHLGTISGKTHRSISEKIKSAYSIKSSVLSMRKNSLKSEI